MAEIDADLEAGESFEVEVEGLLDENGRPRKVLVREARGGQFLMLNRLLRRMTSGTLDMEKRMESTDKFLDLLFAVIVDQEDADDIENALITGKVDIEGLMSLIETASEEVTERPTRSSRDSSSTRRQSGPSSPARSGRRVSASKRSASERSAT